ncbi:hypothetical protein Calkro_2316 [Caldicellulosiruptor kronotskyensis 2002]|uniref:Uncharacterized protein n=1 Tax=Caldicellulosiruptor kronotskyensis (strain DSM 18902 / VKM B-2412 / 2002) TaxID=632348 RepID=E4SHB6_CALK2|nr:hypothetical protein [Caldicellulosiruptor kronotskyensis]ADQ47141.1 hypothetical protein Calkro_2316 [Caldicellulosiruptor kronotskyensis 2002]
MISVSYISSKSLINTFLQSLQNSIDYTIISQGNVLNNLKNNITPDKLAILEMQAQLPSFENQFKIYSPETLRSKSGLEVVQNSFEQMSDLSSPSTLVEMGNQLNLLNKGVLISTQTLQEQDITMLSSSYLFLTKGLSADNLKNLMSKNIPILQDIMMYSYSPQNGVVPYLQSNFSTSVLDVKV